MTNPMFDAAFSNLLNKFRTHEDLRASKADLATLSRSSHELFQARMALRNAAR